MGSGVRRRMNGWYMLLTQLHGVWSETMSEWVIHAPDTVTWGLEWDDEWMSDTCSRHSYMGPGVRQWMNGWYILLTQLHRAWSETMSEWVIHAPDTFIWGLGWDNEWMGDTCSWYSHMGPGVKQLMNGWYMLLIQSHGVWSETTNEWVIHAPDTVTWGLEWDNEWMGDTCSWHSCLGWHNEWMGDTCSWYSHMGSGVRRRMNGWYTLLTQLHGTRSEKWMNGWYMLLTQLHRAWSETMNEWVIHAPDTVT